MHRSVAHRASISHPAAVGRSPVGRSPVGRSSVGRSSVGRSLAALKRRGRRADVFRMPTHRDMPDSWRDNARRPRRRSAEMDAAVERALAARAAAAPGHLDELARRRSARLAAEDARRKATSQPPPGPQAC
jgi:hypothetical protein